MRTRWIVVIGALAALAGLASLAPRTGARVASAGERPAASDAPWEEIVGPAQGDTPAPRRALVWLDDLGRGFAEAQREDRPLFVTLRCLPCKQCSEFDDDVLEPEPELEALLRQFVTVRLTTMRDVDRRILPFEGYQDLDLSWWAYLLAPDGRLYGVYGGRDEVSDKTRISVPSLKATLRRVLAHHGDPRREAWNVDGDAPREAGRPETPTRLPGWRAWARLGAKEADANECLHCHQVADILRMPDIARRRFDKRTDFDDWPFPENVGLRLDRDHGLRVAEVEAKSAAAEAGLAKGDILAAAGGRRLFSQTDFRGALHRGPKGDGAIEVVWTRGGELQRGALQVREGWRQSDLSWRKSVAEAPLGAHMGFPWPLEADGGARKRAGVEGGAMAVRPWFPDKPDVLARSVAYQAGLRGDDTIVAVNGQSPGVFGRAFVIWFRLHLEPGDPVTLDVVGGNGKRRQVRYRAPGR